MLEVLYDVLLNGTAYVISCALIISIYIKKSKLSKKFWYGTLPSIFVAVVILYTEYSLHLMRQVNGVLVGLTLPVFLFLLFSIKYYKSPQTKNFSETSAVLIVASFFFLGCWGWTNVLRAGMFLIKRSRENIGGIDQQLLERWLGLVLGLLLLLLLGNTIVQCFKRLDRKKTAFPVFLFLGIIFIKNFVEFLYGLLILKIYNPGDFMYEMIVKHMNNPQTTVFFLLGGGILIFLISYYKLKIPVPHEKENPAERRKNKAFVIKKRFVIRWALLSMVLNLFTGLSGYAYVNSEQEIRPSTEVKIEADGQFTVMKEDLEDEHIHRFNWITPNNVNVIFWFIKKRENNYGVVFDGCEICGPAGYLEKGGDIICSDCNVMMNRNTIGLKGGCNPIPIKNVIDNPDSITVNAEDLLFQEPFFQGRGMQE